MDSLQAGAYLFICLVFFGNLSTNFSNVAIVTVEYTYLCFKPQSSAT